MLPSEVSHKKILYACLDWGKGHVARSIGVIRQLLEQSNEVVIGCNAEQRVIFQCYFPEVRLLDLEGYNFAFKGHGRFASDLWRLRKSLRKTIRQEQRWVEERCREEGFDLVLSDHRYGFRSASVPSFFLTHQLNLALAPWQWLVQRWHHAQLRAFGLIWVFDQPDSRLAGKLSRNVKKFNVKYIGFYSRFVADGGTKTGGEVVICNGPEPYNEQLLVRYLALPKANRTIIAPPLILKRYQGAEIVSSENWLLCDKLIQQASKIDAYCGYTTLMDLEVLGCEAHLLPTPGQAEQAYLYRLHLAGKTRK